MARSLFGFLYGYSWIPAVVEKGAPLKSYGIFYIKDDLEMI